MREELMHVNGATLWVAEQGEGSPLVLCNGGPGCCDYLGPVAAMVDDLARVYRWEPRGCGRSSATPPYDLEASLTDLDALREALGYDRWIVGGHSAGADLALAYALTYPERTRAVICMSGGRVHNDRDWHAAYSKGRDAGLEREPEYAFPHNLDVNREGNAAWKVFIKQPHLFRRIANLRTPALVIYGSEDIRPSWPVEQVANLLPNGRFEMIDGAGHALWLTHAEAMRSCLRTFVEGQAAGRGK
ncbi:MAG: alpha/beta fold hydrolase [Dehalococcoidia bacterium]